MTNSNVFWSRCIEVPSSWFLSYFGQGLDRTASKNSGDLRKIGQVGSCVRACVCMHWLWIVCSTCLCAARHVLLACSSDLLSCLVKGGWICVVTKKRKLVLVFIYNVSTQLLFFPHSSNLLWSLVWQDVNKYLGANYPIMHIYERALSVGACRVSWC